LLSAAAVNGGRIQILDNGAMLTVHHLNKSQSERIVWLCEELAIQYDLKVYQRDPDTRLAPPEYKALHPATTAPVITDGLVVLGESGACIDYIIGKHGGGRLALKPEHPNFADYLSWYHFANGTLQPVMGRNSLLLRVGADKAHPAAVLTRQRLELALAMVDQRLGEAEFFAGAELTAADIMAVFSLTTMRYYLPLDLGPYVHILDYLQRISQREAYQSAMRKGDPGMALLLT
jgi:glutathione S-transferase